MPSTILDIAAEQALQQRALATSDHLHRWMARQGHDHCLLLLDPVLRPLQDDEPLGQELAALNPRVSYSIRLPGLPDPQCPWLIVLDTSCFADSQALFQSVLDALADTAPERVRAGLGRRVGGWLVSPEPLAAVAAHLARVMAQRQPDGRRVQLHLSNPAVMWPTFSALSPGQRTALMGPIHHWWLPDPAGHPVLLDHPACAAGPMPAWDPRNATELRLTPEQWAGTQHLGSLNAALNRWLAGQPETPRAQPMADAATLALRAQRRALLTHGLQDGEDITRFVQHALMLGPGFDLHPDVQALLRRCRSAERPDGERYAAATDAFTAEDWQRIRAETATPAQA